MLKAYVPIWVYTLRPANLTLCLRLATPGLYHGWCAEHTFALFTYHTDTCARHLSFKSKSMQQKCLSAFIFNWHSLKIRRYKKS